MPTDGSPYARFQARIQGVVWHPRRIRHAAQLRDLSAEVLYAEPSREAPAFPSVLEHQVDAIEPAGGEVSLSQDEVHQ